MRQGLLEQVEARKAELAQGAAPLQHAEAVDAASQLCPGVAALSVAAEALAAEAVSIGASRPVGLSRLVCMADVSGSMSGTPMHVAIALGVLFGAIVGDQIGAQLDERDRLLAAQNLQYSLESTKNGAVTTWQNPNTGNGGTATPTTTVVKSDGTPCREFTTEIEVGGETQQGYGTACRQADGSWKIQS